MEQITNILNISPNLLFSTELLPNYIPNYSGKDQWPYYSFSHGQHISFYTKESLLYIAKQMNLYFYSAGNIHLFSDKKFSPILFRLIVKLSNKGLSCFVKSNLNSKTIQDSISIIANPKS